MYAAGYSSGLGGAFLEKRELASGALEWAIGPISGISGFPTGLEFIQDSETVCLSSAERVIAVDLSGNILHSEESGTMRFDALLFMNGLLAAFGQDSGHYTHVDARIVWPFI